MSMWRLKSNWSTGELPNSRKDAGNTLQLLIKLLRAELTLDSRRLSPDVQSHKIWCRSLE